MDTLTKLFAKLWDDYSAINPQARRIHHLLEARGETVRNDHIAFRTLAYPGIDIKAMSAPFLDLGYKPDGAYAFPEKKLSAIHLIHANADHPKIFISELRLGELSQGARSLLLGLVNQIPPDFLIRPDWCVGGRPWNLDFITYEALERESDYAAWFAAFGFRPNHFTVFANALRTFSDLASLTGFLQTQGFALNTSGGILKGGPGVRLEQASTLANRVEVRFRDGGHTIPGCYYEFARRYPLPQGGLFQGFIAASADKIFESTDRQVR